MRLRQGILVVALVCLGVTAARADGIPNDARIIVGHGPDPNDCGKVQLPSFDISANGTGGGLKKCQNATGDDWVGLTITGTTKAGESIVCKGDPADVFSSCTTEITLEGKKQLVTITLTGGEITANSFFFLDLNDNGGPGNGKGGWEGKLEVKPMLATVPEPASVVLLVAGLGGLWVRQKQRSSPETHL
jgi:hypothetical protein